MKICPACSREYPDRCTLCADCGVALIALNAGRAMRPEDLVGTVVDGRYRIERIIGKGGMGTVYLCRHVVIGKLAAMKVLRPTAERSEGVLQRFVREAQTANAIRTRHIVEMTDFGQLATGGFYVVMELLEGTDLTRAMRSGKLTSSQLLHIFIQVADTLELAHGQDIVHRDLKPDNIFLVNEAGDPLFVKILDFGIAKILDAKATGLTETGVILGTPYYMSPEQARAEHVDNRSDIYALGVIMYRAFAGRLPFIADSSMGVLTKHLTDEPERPRALVDIDPAIEDIILRCLRKKPEERFQTMADLAEALRGVQGGARSVRSATGHLRASPSDDGACGHGSGPYTPNAVFTPSSWVPGFTPSGSHPPAGTSPPFGRDPASTIGQQLPSAPFVAAGTGGVPASGPHTPPSGPYTARREPYIPQRGPYTPSTRPYTPSSGRHTAPSGPHAAPNTYPPNPPSDPHSTPASGPFLPATPIPPPYGLGPYGEGTQRSLVTSSEGRRAAGSGRGLVLVSGATVGLALGAIIAVGMHGTTRVLFGAAEVPVALSTAVSRAASAVLAAKSTALPVAAPAPDAPATAAPVATAVPAKPTGEPVATAAPLRTPRVSHAPPPAPAPSPTAAPARRVPPEVRSPFD